MKSFLSSAINRSKTTKVYFSFYIAVIFSIASLSAATITAVATGNWSSTATWSPAQVPSLSDDVIIPSGFTVTQDVTTGNGGDCKTLTINNGGTLALGVNYITPRTSLTCNGSITASSNTARINCVGTTTVTLYGTINSPNVKIQPSGTSGGKLVIDAAAIVTASILGLSTNANLQIDGSLTLSATVTQPVGTTITINGTLNITGGTFQTAGTINGAGTIALTPGTAASAALTTNATTGSITIGTLNLTPNTGSGSISICNNTAGGSLTATNCTINGTNVGSASVSFGLTAVPTSSPSINITNFTNNAATTVNFNQYATYGTIGSMTIANDLSSRSTNINSNLSVNNLTITLGRIRLNQNNVVLSVNSSITGGSSSSFIYTRSSTISGTAVRCTAIPTSGMTVPLGGTRYYPITATPTATADLSFSIMGQIAQTGYATNFTTAALDLTKTVQAEYGVTNNGVSTATVNLTLGYGASDYGSAYSATSPKGVARSSGSWVQISGIAGATSATITNEAIPAAAAYFYGVSADGGLASIVVLPVELQSFSGKTNGKTNLLTWSTASEKDNAQFIVERSADGQNFNMIGSIKGNGTTATKNDYTFSDDDPLSMMNYYRIKSVDFNGAEVVSKTVSVITNKGNDVKIYPSVVNDVLTLESSTNDEFTLIIYDIMGREIIRQRAIGQTQVPVHSLSKGLYAIMVEKGYFKITEKFVKQ